jgi:catechol 2,3-dioxygenase-like lactoylglutathione lyase family enzyme
MSDHPLVPNLAVRDVPASQAYYRDVLGARVNWIWDDTFGSVCLGPHEVFLYRSEDPHPAICSVFVDDVDWVHTDVRSRGAEVVEELGLRPWGVREFSVRDPDGNVFRIGTLGAGPAEEHRFTSFEEEEVGV